jgi:hypothetical protein
MNKRVFHVAGRTLTARHLDVQSAIREAQSFFAPRRHYGKGEWVRRPDSPVHEPDGNAYYHYDWVTSSLRRNRLHCLKWPARTRHFYVSRNGYITEYDARDRTQMFEKTDKPPRFDDVMFIVHVRPR